MHLLRLLRTGQQPCAAYILPVVRQLHLLAFHDLLLEKTQLIADGIPRGGDLQRGHAVQIAGGQTAKAAVAEAGVRLVLEEVGRLEAQLLHGLGQRVHKAEIIGVFYEAASHEELQGQVVHLPELLLVRFLPRGDVPLGHNVPQNHGAGTEHIAVPRLLGRAAAVDAQLLQNCIFQCVLGHFVLLVVSVMCS